MAEVRKREKVEKYRLEDIDVKKNKKEPSKKKVTKSKPKKDNSSKSKKSLWAKFRIFCNGVGDETKKVHWTSKSDMFKYSVATICFIVFCSLFFYLIDVLFALVQSLFS